MEGNYQSTGSRDPIWTRVVREPSFQQQTTQREGQNEHRHVQPEPEMLKIHELKPTHGLNVLSAAVFLAGEMAGSGLLALPKAVVDSGWIGLILLIFFCINTGYCGTRLGVCWSILEERYPEYRNPVRNPYASIAHRAVGIWGSRIVSLCIQLTLFGGATVNMLVTSQIIQELFEDLLPVTYCTWLIVLAMCLCPAMWLGSPKDFWVVGFGALLTTAFAFVFMFTQIVMDGLNAVEPVKHEPHGFSSLFLAFGTFLYAFGGVIICPTIQNDMINKKKLPTSAISGFSMILALAIPVSAGGYFVYGDAVTPNIIMSISNTTLIYLANILMLIHLVLGFLIVVNPVCQELEQIFNVPTHFNWKRIVVRTGILCLMVVIGETVPSFGSIITLVGGSTVTLLILVFPSFFYMRLCDRKGVGWRERPIPTFLRIYLWELILIGIVVGTATTYNAFLEIFSGNSQTVPCYWGL